MAGGGRHPAATSRLDAFRFNSTHNTKRKKNSTDKIAFVGGAALRFLRGALAIAVLFTTAGPEYSRAKSNFMLN